jgi:hypothetical protein
MSVFVAVVEAASLSAAGRKLGMPVTTVSREIAELEAPGNGVKLEDSERDLIVALKADPLANFCRDQVTTMQVRGIPSRTDRSSILGGSWRITRATIWSDRSTISRQRSKLGCRHFFKG